MHFLSASPSKCLKIRSLQKTNVPNWAQRLTGRATLLIVWQNWELNPHQKSDSQKLLYHNINAQRPVFNYSCIQVCKLHRMCCLIYLIVVPLVRPALKLGFYSLMFFLIVNYTYILIIKSLKMNTYMLVARYKTHLLSLNINNVKIKAVKMFLFH